MAEWNADFGDPDRTEMAAVLHIIDTGSVEEAERLLAARYPWVRGNTIGILVRLARQHDRAGRTDELNADVHQFIHRAIASKPDPAPPASRAGLTGRLAFWRWGR
jgi:hypothetical protein